MYGFRGDASKKPGPSGGFFSRSLGGSLTPGEHQVEVFCVKREGKTHVSLKASDGSSHFEIWSFDAPDWLLEASGKKVRATLGLTEGFIAGRQGTKFRLYDAQTRKELTDYIDLQEIPAEVMRLGIRQATTKIQSLRFEQETFDVRSDPEPLSLSEEEKPQAEKP